MFLNEYSFVDDHTYLFLKQSFNSEKKILFFSSLGTVFYILLVYE